MSLCGLLNFGTDCYINSITQLLISLNIFEKCILYDTNSALLSEFKYLSKNMVNNKIVNPNKWLNSIRLSAEKNEILEFNEFNQSDVTEFLLFILDEFHKANKRSVSINISGQTIKDQDDIAITTYKKFKLLYENDYSDIIYHFYGFGVTTISSRLNSSKSIISESFNIISLAIPDVHNNLLTIYNCFDEYFKDEELKEDNLWYNEDTKNKEPAIKTYKVWQFPNILIISFKRFNNNGNKDKRLIYSPLYNLDLCKYSIGYDSHNSFYTLHAVCNHFGNTSLGGHYTITINNNNKWLHYNDSTIEEVNPNNVITQASYCLVYKKNIK